MSEPQECPLTEQAVGWALHALEPDEEMAVLLHLPQCAACRAAAYDAEQVLAGLGGTVPLVEPPAGLRDRLMAEVAETPQRPPVLGPRAVEPDAARPVPSAAAPPAPVPLASVPTQGGAADRRSRPDDEDVESAAARRGGRSTRGGRRGRLVATALVAAAVISIGGLAVRTTQLERERDAETAQAQTLSGLLAERERERDAESAQARTLSELIAELGEPDSRYALLADVDTGSTVAVVLVDDRQRRVYSLALPANAADSVYVAWGLPAGGAPVPLGTFDVAPAEPGPLPVGPASEAERFPQYAVSIEPGRVAPASPSTVVASGEVTV